MSTNIERATEVIAAEGLLVTDERTEIDRLKDELRAVQRSRYEWQRKALEGAVDRFNDVKQAERLLVTDEQQRLIRLGEAVELFRGARQVRQDHVRYKFAWDQCLDAIYAEAERSDK